MAAPNQSASYVPKPPLCLLHLTRFQRRGYGDGLVNGGKCGLKALKISTNVKCFVVENPVGKHEELSWANRRFLR